MVVAQTAVVRHVLCYGNLPHWQLSQPELSSYNIEFAYHKIMLVVLMTTLKEIIMMPYEHTAGPFCFPAMHCYGASSCVYAVSKEPKESHSISFIQGQCTGRLGKTIHRVVTNKLDVRKRPHEEHNK